MTCSSHSNSTGKKSKQSQRATIANEYIGEVIKLDRGFPLVELENGKQLRCEHATSMAKQKDKHTEHSAIAHPVIGDQVSISIPDSHEMGIIKNIFPRHTSLIRKDPNERTASQVLAANFNQVIIVQPINNLNLRRLERELVLAFETGASVCVLLTKWDLTSKLEGEQNLEAVQALVGDSAQVLTSDRNNPQDIAAIKDLLAPNTTTILIGQSGVGKSTLINKLVGTDVRKTQSVREHDQKGRHTTVSREILQIPGAGRIVDMPGVRGLGLWNAANGIAAAFSDLEELAQNCKFRDCSHNNEPGCAIKQAVEEGQISQERVNSYLSLKEELENILKRREQSTWR